MSQWSPRLPIITLVLNVFSWTIRPLLCLFFTQQPRHQLDAWLRFASCYLEKWVAPLLKPVSSSKFATELPANAEAGAVGSMAMGGSNHFFAALTQSSWASLQSCLVEDSMVPLNIVFLLQCNPKFYLHSTSQGDAFLLEHRQDNWAGHSKLRYCKQLNIQDWIEARNFNINQKLTLKSIS